METFFAKDSSLNISASTNPSSSSSSTSPPSSSSASSSSNNEKHGFYVPPYDDGVGKFPEPHLSLLHLTHGHDPFIVYQPEYILSFFFFFRFLFLPFRYCILFRLFDLRFLFFRFFAFPFLLFLFFFLRFINIILEKRQRMNHSHMESWSWKYM